MNGLFGLEDHWLWLIVGVALGIAEMLVPGVFLIWIGAAAVLTGVVALLLPIGTIPQFLIFAVATIAAIYAGRRYLATNPIVSADPLLNDRLARLVGEVVTAVEPVDANGGRVRVGDSVWNARGGPAVPGEKLRITGAERGVLTVEGL